MSDRRNASFAFLVALGLAAVSFAPSPAAAKPCHDASGKFVKCSAMSTAPMPTRCRDASGKFMKCSSAMGPHRKHHKM